MKPLLSRHVMAEQTCRAMSRMTSFFSANSFRLRMNCSRHPVRQVGERERERGGGRGWGREKEREGGKAGGGERERERGGGGGGGEGRCG